MPAAPDAMLLTYKYRLNPNERQHRALERILEQQRQLYNAALEERILAWAKGRSISEVDQSRALTQIRADDPAFAGVQRRIQRATLKRLDRSYKAFFRRAKAGAGASSGFPKFKGREHFDGFAFDAFAQITLSEPGPRWGLAGTDETGMRPQRSRTQRLRFAGMPGGLRVFIDRPLPSVADPETGELRTVIKGVWFKRDGARWYVGFQVQVPVRADRAGLGGGEIGVDWGTSVLAALSTGETVANPCHGEALQGDLTRAQRAVARKKKGSRSRRKARRHLQAVQRRIASRRRTAMDKLSKRLVTHWRLVATEKIAAKSLIDAERPGETLPEFVKTRRNRELADAAPFQLRQMIAYKARLMRAEVVEIDPAAKLADGTRAQPTQRCSMCGRLHFKELTEDHVCTTPGPHLGMRLARKVNAARVVLSLAREGYGNSSLAEDHGGGPVPGGLDGGSDAGAARNVRDGARRLGNTEGERSPTGRRPERDPFMLDARRRMRARFRRVSGW